MKVKELFEDHFSRMEYKPKWTESQRISNIPKDIKKNFDKKWKKIIDDAQGSEAKIKATDNRWKELEELRKKYPVKKD